jgi:hypothetical protein
VSVPSLATEVRLLRSEGRDSYGRAVETIRQHHVLMRELADVARSVVERLASSDVELGPVGSVRSQLRRLEVSADSFARCAEYNGELLAALGEQTEPGTDYRLAGERGHPSRRALESRSSARPQFS